MMLRAACFAIATWILAALPASGAPMPVRGANPVPLAATGLGPNWLANAWATYKQHFVREGRVIDDVNRISHSEGQGYAMLIAVKAGDRAGFNEIWQWTQRELYIDPSGLAAWKWDDRASRPISDQNNASDGDILIAWALIEAGQTWHDASYVRAARRIVSAIETLNVAATGAGPVLIPGRIGFSPADHPDGQVLNLSYWVFPALDRFREIEPEADWAAIRETGLRLLRESRFGPLQLPSDWISVRTGKPAPAQTFPARFSYNAIRIPLYLAWAKITDPNLLRSFARLWNEKLNLGPFETELASGSALASFGGTGFKAVVATAKCALHHDKLDPSLRKVEAETYYSTTLHILSLIALQERYPECL